MFQKKLPLLLCVSHSVLSDSFATPWTGACHASLSMGFPRQEYWSGFLLQEIFLDQGLNPCLLHWQVDSLRLSHQGVTLQVFIANRKLVAYTLQVAVSYQHCSELLAYIIICHLSFQYSDEIKITEA